jgi:hypothetical protein
MIITNSAVPHHHLLLPVESFFLGHVRNSWMVLEQGRMRLGRGETGGHVQRKVLVLIVKDTAGAIYILLPMVSNLNACVSRPLSCLLLHSQLELLVRSMLAPPPTTGVGEDAGKKEPSYTVGGNVN